MSTRKSKIIYSDFCGFIKQKSLSLEIFIVRVEGSRFWTLEVRSECGTNYTWAARFLSDCDAYLTFARCLIEGKFQYEGDFNCVEPDYTNIIMFPERRAGQLPREPSS